MGIKLVLLLCLLSLTLQMGKFECDVAGCQSCKGNNICQVCQKNYVLQTVEGAGRPTCVKTECPENCATCNEDLECETCAEGFLLSQGGSCQSEEDIAEIQAKRRVLQFNNNGNLTNCTIPNCAVCSGSTCANCSVGYQRTSSGSCMSCNIANCAYCSSPDVCGVCSPLMVLLVPSTNGGSCLQCNTNQTNMGGCSSCVTNNTCGQCSNGFELFAGLCVNCTISNCLACGLLDPTSPSPICIVCAPGYSVNPSGNACTQCLFPCQTCNGNVGPNNCATCATPQFFEAALQNGTCLRNLIPGCIRPDSANNTLCGLCAPGFVLTTEKLRCNWTCPLNCQACSDNVTCTTCVTGFFVNSTGSCNVCPKGCATCATDGQTCLSCVRGFYLFGTECKACPGFCLDCTTNTTCTQLVESNNQVLLVINGQSVLAVCESICLTCSNRNPQVCLECIPGFYINNGRCRRCQGSCRTCSQTNSTQCLSCHPNTFLTNGNCVSCNSNCKTCVGADATSNCTSCWDGFYLQNSKCQKGCPKNCFTCSNLTTCTQCLSGYTTFTRNGQIICAPCMTSCRTCAEGKPSTCLTCGQGFYLKGTTCSPCSTNCASCTASGCLTCSQGFFLTSEQTCAEACTLPCATCSVTNPESCLSCIAGYSFNDVTKRCNEVTECVGGCVACPMGYSLKDGSCLRCTTQNCQSCNPNSLGECFSCKPTFFLNNQGTCQSCPEQCRTCFSGSACLTCAEGYTKKENAVSTSNGFECVKCNAPCATCRNTPDYCTSCVEGFDFFGWKCAQKFRFSFALTLTVSLVLFESNYVVLIETFAGALQVSDTNAITITSITEGSVKLDGSAAPTGAPGSSQAGSQLQGLSSLINSGNIAGMSIGASSLTVQEGSVGAVPTEESKTNVLAIVLGICIPVGVLIIIGIIVFVVYKKKAAQKVRDFDTEEERNKNHFNTTNDKIVN